MYLFNIYLYLQENVDLQRKLREAMGYRDKFFKNEEANDEFQGLATQELAKVKHMVSLKLQPLVYLRIVQPCAFVTLCIA